VRIRLSQLTVFSALAASGCERSAGKLPEPGPVQAQAQAPAVSTRATPSALPSASSTTPTPIAVAVAQVAVRLPVKNVLVISIDSLRADMPWSGYDRPIAPVLTALEKTCVSYTHAYAASSYTSMSVGGFLGGKHPSELKRDGFFFGTYNKDNLFFPEVLSAKGFTTISSHAHGYFSNAGFQQGFSKWEIVPNLKWNAQTDENVTSPQHEALAEKMLSAMPADKPFFAWFHFLDPHDQYMPHEKDGIPSYGKKLRDQYDGEVQFTDGYVGKLLEFAKKQTWWSETALLITSDHGEALGEHGQYRHGFELWENLVRVPLFVCAPGAAPKHIDAKRTGLDLASTILELLSIPAEASFTGQSLVSEVYGGKAEDKDIVVDLPATSNNDKRRALVHEHFKIIGYGESMFTRVFDLEKDPGEMSPVSSSDPIVQEMQKRLAAYNKTLKEVPATACGKGCLEGTK
jgi:choline-sulfatase